MSFSADQVKQIRMRLVWAQAEMIPGTSEELQVFAAGDEDSLQALKVDMEEGTLGISQPALQSMAHKRWLQICVRVPQAWSGDIDVDSVSGTVGAHGLDGGELVFATVSGPIHLEDMRARLLRLRTVSGAIAGVGIDTERLAVRTAAGQIGLREMRFDSARAFTVSGTTELMLREGCGTLELQSVSGAVSVEVEGTACAQLHSLSGQFLLDEALRGEENGLKIYATSVSGGLAVKRRKKDHEDRHIAD